MKQTEFLKEKYPPNTRIKLILMGEDPNPVPPESEGVVQYVDDAGNIHVKWDNGRTLSLIYGEDEFIKLGGK